jgi:uncharacterized protein (TIGR02145 family)
VRCNGATVTNNLTWTPAGRIPTAAGTLSVSVSRGNATGTGNACAGMTALCGNVSVAESGSENGTFTDLRDGKTYKWVKIGTQTWMAENLNYGGPESDPNSIGMCVDEFSSSGPGPLFSSSSRCNIYGRLYNWDAALTVCPSGWHLPSDAEWTALTNHAGGASVAGTKLKANSSLWISNTGTDDFGFSALPGGVGGGSSFNFVGIGGYWWSSSATEDDASKAWYRIMGDNNSNVLSINQYDKSYLLSVRCVED